MENIDSSGIDLSVIEKLISREVLDKLKEDIRMQVMKEIEGDSKVYNKKIREYIYKNRYKDEASREKYNAYMRNLRKKKKAEKENNEKELNKIKIVEINKQLEKINGKLAEINVDG